MKLQLIITPETEDEVVVAKTIHDQAQVVNEYVDTVIRDAINNCFTHIYGLDNVTESVNITGPAYDKYDPPVNSKLLKVFDGDEKAVKDISWKILSRLLYLRGYASLRNLLDNDTKQSLQNLKSCISGQLPCHEEVSDCLDCIKKIQLILEERNSIIVNQQMKEDYLKRGKEMFGSD